MITDADIQKLKRVFVTKDEFSNLKNDIVDFKDSILSEIIKLREDIENHDHDQRIEKLETTIFQ